jgi:hypothetical protein
MIDTAMMVVRPRRMAWNRSGDGRLMIMTIWPSLEFQAEPDLARGRGDEVAALQRMHQRPFPGAFLQ